MEEYGCGVGQVNGIMDMEVVNNPNLEKR